MIPQNFTNKSQEVIQNAARIACENGQSQEDLRTCLALS